MADFDSITFYSKNEINKMISQWETWYDAVDSGKDQYQVYPKCSFSLDELQREIVRRTELEIA